jgi:hypothetical protein
VNETDVVSETDGGTPAFRRAAEHVFVGVGQGIASTVYGTIVAMATLTAAFGSEKDPWRLAVIVATASFVLWVAHVYAHILAASLELKRRLALAEVESILRRELGILLATILPIAMLVLGALGVLHETAAVWLALGIGLATLGAEGLRYARVERLGPAATIAATGLNLALGLVVVALKVEVFH